MSAYDVEGWSDLFVATAGATAALAGLVFVAVSINIQAILKIRGLPERGLQTVLLLLAALVVSVFGLVPQSTTAFGVEVTVVGVALVGWLVYSVDAAISGATGKKLWLASRLVVIVPGSVAYVVAGPSLLLEAGGGMTWVLAGIVGGIIGAVINAWVLLVEILR